jgi:hypothetical protein
MWDGFDRTMVVYWSCALEYSISEPLANCSAPERNVREVGPLRGRSRTDRQSLSSNCPSIVLLDRCGIYWVLDARPKISSVPPHIARKSHTRRGELNSLISVSNTIFADSMWGKTEKCVGLNGPNGESLASGILLGVE